MASSAPTPTPTLDDLWASDRARVSVVVAATPKPGVDFATARDALLAVRWDERSLEWHSTRRGPRDAAAAAAPDDDDAFVVEAVGSCLASGGDESSVAPRVAALAAARFDDAELVVSAPCHVPFLEVRDGVDDPRVRVAAAALLEKEESQGDDARARAVAAFAELGLAASRRRCVASEDLARLTRAATRRMAAAERAMATRHGSVRFGEDAFAFREMGSRGGQRFDLLFPREGEEEEEGGGEGAGEGGGESPQGTAFTTRTGSYGNQSGLERDERDGGDGGEGDAAFVRAFARRAPWVRALVDPILSPPPLSSSSSSSANSASPRRTWWCDVSIVYSKPGARAQDWHCDGRHLAGAARANHAGVGASPPYAICVFVPLVDLNGEVGFTQFWAGSHKADALIGFGSAAEVLRGGVDGKGASYFHTGSRTTPFAS
jgi:hypothetical protein